MKGNISFLLCLWLGIYFLIVSVVTFKMLGAFKADTRNIVICGLIGIAGCALIYIARTHFPFEISMGGKS